MKTKKSSKSSLNSDGVNNDDSKKKKENNDDLKKKEENNDDSDSHYTYSSEIYNYESENFKANNSPSYDNLEVNANKKSPLEYNKKNNNDIVKNDNNKKKVKKNDISPELQKEIDNVYLVVIKKVIREDLSWFKGEGHFKSFLVRMIRNFLRTKNNQLSQSGLLASLYNRKNCPSDEDWQKILQYLIDKKVLKSYNTSEDKLIHSIGLVDYK